MIETDCSEALEVAQNVVANNHPDRELVEEIQRLLHCEWNAEIIWCS